MIFMFNLDRPESPYNVRAAWTHAASVNITWDWSKKFINGRELTTAKFRAYYKNMQVGELQTTSPNMVINRMFHFSCDGDSYD